MKNQNGSTGSHDRPGKPSPEQIDLILATQRAAGIDTWKSIEHPLAIAIASQWLRGNLTQAEMGKSYQNLATLCPAICLVVD